MGLYGRRDIPGDQNPRDYINQEDVLNRTIRAQVSAVEPAQGYCILTFESLPGGGRYATVPPLWMSFPPDATSNGPAWGRYMPQQTDLVKVAFDYDDRAQIVGFDIAAGKDLVADGKAGWPQLNDQYNNANSNPNVPTNRAKFAQFTPLNPGEYDFMSSGGAYIYGNDNGRLYLAGGAVSVSLIKNDLRLFGRAQLWSHLADDCDFRFGQVRRVNQQTQAEEAVPADANGVFKEFAVHIMASPSPGNSTALGDLTIGNVVDVNGDVINSTITNNPFRSYYINSSDSGVQNLTQGIDNVGNWEVIAPNAPTGVNFDFSMGTWTTKFQDIKHTAISSYQITAPTCTYNASTSFSVNSPNISLGQDASNPLILSNIYRPAEDALISGLVTAITGVTTALSTLAASLGAASAALALTAPASGPAAPSLIPLATALTAATVSLSAAIPVAAAAATAAQTVFQSAEETYLSNIAKNA